MLLRLWPSPPSGAPKTPTKPIKPKPKRKRSSEPQPFAERAYRCWGLWQNSSRMGTSFTHPCHPEEPSHAC